MNTPLTTKVLPVGQIGHDQDLVTFAAFSFFKGDGTPMAVRFLAIAIEQAFKRAGLQFRGGEWCGDNVLVVCYHVPEKREALRVLRAMAAQIKGVAGLKIGWFDKAEGVWRECYATGFGVERTFESLETLGENFVRVLQERERAGPPT